MYPHAPESEMVILASLIQNQETKFIFQIIKKEMFADPDNELIYSICAEIEQMGLVIDVPIVVDCLRGSNQLEKIGGAEKITQLDHTAVYNLERHCNRLIAAKENRDIFNEFNEIQNSIQIGDYESVKIQLSGVARVLETPVSRGHFVVDFNAPCDELDYVWGHYIPTGSITMVSGNGGAGKTYFALCLAISVAAGIDFLGEKVNHGRVIYYSCEEDEFELRRRINKIHTHLNLHDSTYRNDFRVIDATGDSLLYEKINNQSITTTAYFSLQKQIDDFSPSLVIIDNSTFAFSGDENIKSEVIDFMNRLKSLIRGKKCGLLLVSHLNRSGKTDQDNYAGSAGWNAAAKSRISLLDGEIKDQVILRHEKSNFSERHFEKTLQLVKGIPQVYQINQQVEKAQQKRLEDNIIKFVRSFSPSVAQSVFLREFKNSLPANEQYDPKKIVSSLGKLLSSGLLKMESDGKKKIYICTD